MADEPGVDLPDGMVEWIAEIGAGRVTRLERHIARREAWVRRHPRADGTVGEYFLRLDRGLAQAASPWSVHKEMRVVDTLRRAGLPVPEVHGWNDTLQAALVRAGARARRPPGRHDSGATPRGVGPVHGVRRRSPLARTARPRSRRRARVAAGCAGAALDEVDKLEQLMSADVVEPLATFGSQWLRRYAPTELDRVVLVQGDTGPGNFLFENSELTGVIDFEWAHFGDPMEDFGNMAVREFFYPSANLAEVFPLYEKLGGDPIDYDRVRYYRVHQMVRSVIALVQMTTLNDPTTPVALNLCYRVICDRATCEAIADAMQSISNGRRRWARRGPAAVTPSVRSRSTTFGARSSRRSMTPGRAISSNIRPCSSSAWTASPGSVPPWTRSRSTNLRRSSVRDPRPPKRVWRASTRRCGNGTAIATTTCCVTSHVAPIAPKSCTHPSSHSFPPASSIPRLMEQGRAIWRGH